MRMYQCKRNIISLCVLLCSIGTWTAPVQAAAEEVKLTVRYVYDDMVIQGTDVGVYLVAEKIAGKYQKTPQFETLTISFEELGTLTSWSDEGNVIEAYIAENACAPEDSQTIDDAGNAVFDEMTEGIYFVDVENMNYKNGTLVCDPVLITLPLYSNETNKFTYAVEMQPKVDFRNPPPPITPPPSPPTEPTPPPTPTDPVPPPPEPTVPEPTIPDEPDVPLVDIPDDEVPQTGTISWIIAPLVMAGIAFFSVSIFGFRKKKGEE